MATIGELKKNISHLSDDTPVAYMLWLVEDAKSLGASEDEAIEAVHRMHEDGDASLGMSWNTLEANLDWVKDTKED